MPAEKAQMKLRPAPGHSWTRAVIPSLRWLLLCVLMLEFTLLLLLLAGRWTASKPRDEVRVSSPAARVVEPTAPTADSYIEEVRSLHAQVGATFPAGGTLADASPEELAAFRSAVDDAYQNLVALVVPAEFRSLHFQLVLAYNGLREASIARTAEPADATDQPDPAAQESDARSRIQSLATEYPWVTAF